MSRHGDDDPRVLPRLRPREQRAGVRHGGACRGAGARGRTRRAHTLELLRHGDWFVGTLVLVFSVVFPLTKIVLLLELSLLGLLGRRHKALTYRIMEHAGRWSMMDVMLLAWLVMLVKLGTLVQFHFGPAVIAFVGCVAMSMLASLCFDPHSIWESS